MRIAVFHELPQGGAKRAINEYARELKKKHTVDLFIVDDKRNIQEDKFYSSTYFYKFLPMRWKGNNWKIRVYKDTYELVKLYFLNRKIAKEIDKNKYDIVLVSASKYIEAPFIMRFLRTPFIFYIHDPYYRIIYDPMLKISKQLSFIKYSYEMLNRFVRKALDKQNIDCAKLCLVPSKFIAELFSKTYRKTCKVVYYGINTNLFKEGNTEKDIDVFYIGSMSPIDDYSLVEHSIKLMKKFKPKVRILLTDKEWISDDKKLVNLYQRSKVLLATAHNEGLGAVPLEAMACGVPVIATNEAGHKETIVNGVTGYLLPRNPKLFAEKLDWLLSCPKERDKMGNTARDIMIKNWSWESRSGELLSIFQDYLSKAK